MRDGVELDDLTEKELFEKGVQSSLDFLNRSEKPCGDNRIDEADKNIFLGITDLVAMAIRLENDDVLEEDGGDDMASFLTGMCAKECSNELRSACIFAQTVDLLELAKQIKHSCEGVLINTRAEYLTTDDKGNIFNENGNPLDESGDILDIDEENEDDDEERFFIPIPVDDDVPPEGNLLN